MNTILETKRLLLRQFTEEDTALFFELNSDPEVTRYTHDPVSDLQHAEEILKTIILPQYALYNLGRWAVHLKSASVQGEFIGWCGLKYHPRLKETDLGFRFKKIFWGKGYATEAAAACINYGFKTLNLKTIVGRAEPENIASCRVLEKCGMTFTGNDVEDGYPVRCYEILNPG